MRKSAKKSAVTAPRGSRADVLGALYDEPMPATRTAQVAEGALRDTATALAKRLMERLCQHSFSIVGPAETEWFSRRPAQ